MLEKVEVDSLFAARINDVPRSFIREILKVALQPDMISFAGGLPNKDLFPKDELRAATEKVFDRYGDETLQYSSTEGFLPLREYISQRYKQKNNLDVPVERILITSGSQQGLDLLGKVLLNERDSLVIEEPGYLGAIQAFSIYQPEFFSVPVGKNGMDESALERALAKKIPKLIYAVPNFQNPSGISYPEQNRRNIAALLQGKPTLLVEDDPYGDLRFHGAAKPSFYELIEGNTILLGSFSKVIVPGFRLGWIVAPKDITSKLIVAKQAADLHTTHFTQSIIHQYLTDNDLDQHIARITEVYGRQQRAMIEAIATFFPSDIIHTRPEGGMFLWAELPREYSAQRLFDLAVAKNVVFVPGDPFYIGKTDTNTLRLNFSCVDELAINTGIKRLGRAVTELLHHDHKLGVEGGNEN